jgi:hypothetical protein
VFRPDSITPQLASYAYDLGNTWFANSWVATGAIGICAGLVMLRAPFALYWAWVLAMSILLPGLAGGFQLRSAR